MNLSGPFAAILLAQTFVSFAEEPLRSPRGTFQIRQTKGEDWEACISFSDSRKPPVHLSRVSWPGVFSISPNDEWILRIQKVGSGENVGFLYRIENTGRVFEVLEFNKALWRTSDDHSRLKHRDLYHPAIEAAVWSSDSKTLLLHLRGSNAKKNNDGLLADVIYDLRNHRFSLSHRD
jgi:hypothetical protein